MRPIPEQHIFQPVGLAENLLTPTFHLASSLLHPAFSSKHPRRNFRAVHAYFRGRPSRRQSQLGRPAAVSASAPFLQLIPSTFAENEIRPIAPPLVHNPLATMRQTSVFHQAVIASPPCRQDMNPTLYSPLESPLPTSV